MVSLLGSDADKGISSNDLKERERIFGSNSRSPSKGKEVFDDLVEILITTAFASFLASMEFREGLIDVSWIKCSTLLIILILVSLITFIK